MRWIQLIVALSFLVIIRELGHFTFARIFKVRVEKFYMFFNPQFSLFRAKKVGGRWRFRFFAKNIEPAVVPVIDEITQQQKVNAKGQPVFRPMTDDERAALPEDDWRRDPDNTEWGIGWIPLGGYCSIAGMIDETKSATDLPSEPQSWEFRSKPAWQRLFIILGGILVNFIAALVMFGLILFSWGQDSMPLHNIDTGLYYSELLQEEGFQQQDKILTINGQEPQELGDVIEWLIIEGKQNVAIQRGNDTLTLVMSKDLGTRYLALQNDFDKQEREKQRADDNYQKRSYQLIGYFMPFVVDSVIPEGAAYYGGLQQGDSIVGINGNDGLCFIQIGNELRKHPCDSVTVDYYRHGQPQHAGVFIGDNGKLDVYSKSLLYFYDYEHTDYTFFQSIPAGIKYGWDMLAMYVKQFRLVFTKEGAQSLGGFGAIGNMFPTTWDWFSFWHMTAFLSLILAFMNFLPIPALDGGYILFLLWEIITRRKPSDRFLEIANNIGFWLLLALLIYANGNDIFKAFF